MAEREWTQAVCGQDEVAKKIGELEAQGFGFHSVTPFLARDDAFPGIPREEGGGATGAPRFLILATKPPPKTGRAAFT